MGSYRRAFDVPAEWAGRQIFLHFAGMSSAMYVWVNGREVGYAEGSKIPVEFDVTDVVRAGQNQLAVEVYRWSDGSYLEDVDFWRMSRIDRDVFLFSTPTVAIRDFFFEAGLDDAYTDGRLAATVTLANHGESAAGTRAVELGSPRPVRTIRVRAAHAPDTGDLPRRGERLHGHLRSAHR